MEDKKLGKLLWKPTPKQKLLLQSPAFETLYGGGKGGGKSLALLAIARNNHHRSLILRRDFTQLQGSLIDQSKEKFPSEFYNSTEHVWRFPDGCLIRFAHALQADDVHLYDGSEYDLVGIDQVEQFTLEMYEYFFSITRTTERKQRCRIIATANPVGEYVDWVVERWRHWVDENDTNPAKPGELRWFAKISNKETEVADGTPFMFNGERIVPVSRTFIPALVADNPYLNPEYVSQLQGLPEPLKSQLLYGKWNAGAIEDPYQVNKRNWVNAAQERWTEENPYSSFPLSLGVDVAAGGDDRTVLAKCYKTWYDRLIVRHGVETDDGQKVAQLVMANVMQGGNVMIDMNTWGSSAYDQLKNSGMPVVGFNGGEKSEAHDRSGKLSFANKRTEAYWKFREALDPANGYDIRLPPDDELKADLCAPRWEFIKDKLRVEPKEKTMERIGRSPDKADAVVYAWLMAQQDWLSAGAIIVNHEYEIWDG